LGKIIKHKDRLIRVKVSSNDHKFDILSKTPSFKKSKIFINQDQYRTKSFNEKITILKYIEPVNIFMEKIF